MIIYRLCFFGGMNNYRSVGCLFILAPFPKILKTIQEARRIMTLQLGPHIMMNMTGKISSRQVNSLLQVYVVLPISCHCRIAHYSNACIRHSAIHVYQLGLRELFVFGVYCICNIVLVL